MKFDPFFQRYEPDCGNVEESFKIFLDPHPEADDFQNLNSFSSSTVTSMVKFLRKYVQ